MTGTGLDMWRRLNVNGEGGCVVLRVFSGLIWSDSIMRVAGSASPSRLIEV